MPDPNQPINPTQTTDPATPVGMPVVEEITIPTLNTPPTDAPSPPPPPGPPETASSPPPDLPPVVPPVITPPPAKKFGGRRVIATILGLLVLGGGLTAGLILVRQQQIFREKAQEACTASDCGCEAGFRCVGTRPDCSCEAEHTPYCAESLNCKYGCSPSPQGGDCNTQPPPQAPPCKVCRSGSCTINDVAGCSDSNNECESNSGCPQPTPNTHTSCTACSGGSIVQCVTVASPPNCDPNLNVCKDNSECAPGGLPRCVSPASCVNNYSCPSTVGTDLGVKDCGPAYTCCQPKSTASCTSPAQCVNNYSCPSYVGTDLGTKDCGPAYTCCSPKTTAGCTSPAQCVNNYSCPSYVGTDLGTKDCGPAYTCCSPKSSPGTPPPGVTPPPGTPLPAVGGGGGTPLPAGVSAQCLNIQAFDTNWTQITNLSTIKAGDKVRFTVAGTATTGTFDKARFTINGTLRPEVTQTRPGTSEFYDEYTIPEGTTSFSINAQLHNTVLGWF